MDSSSCTVTPRKFPEGAGWLAGWQFGRPPFLEDTNFVSSKTEKINSKIYYLLVEKKIDRSLSVCPRKK